MYLSSLKKKYWIEFSLKPRKGRFKGTREGRGPPPLVT